MDRQNLGRWISSFFDRVVLLRVLLFILILFLLIIHGVEPTWFSVDPFTLTLLGFLSLLALSPTLKSAKLPGGFQFDFHKVIEVGEGFADQLKNRAKQGDGVIEGPRLGQPGLFDIPKELRKLASTQPGVAVAQLRVQVLRGLHTAARGLSQFGYPTDLDGLVDFVIERGQMWPEQTALLRVIVRLSEESLLSGEVSAGDAHRVISISDVLNESFAIGYSLNFKPNLDWEAQGRICEYEHCIENMPFPEIPRSEQLRWRANIQEMLSAGKYSKDPQRQAHFEGILADPIPDDAPEEVDRSGACPIFGHFCPGGATTVAKCDAAQDWLSLVDDQSE